jgi:hypothetical protein
MRSLARLFSSSRRAPPKAASKCHLSSACRRPSVLVDVYEHVHADASGGFVAKRDHLAEFPGGIDMQQRKRRLSRRKSFLRDV